MTAAMVVTSTMFKVYDLSNSETRVSNLFPNFPVVNTTWEAVHVQFPIRKLVFTIIPIAREGSINHAVLKRQLAQWVKVKSFTNVSAAAYFYVT